MAADAGPAPEHAAVRRWRRIFTGAYLAFTLGAIAWALVSMLAVHCGSGDLVRRPRVSGPLINVDNADELRRCHRDVERLLVGLHEKTFALQARALKYDIDPATEWRTWSESWRQRWRVVETRCRLRDVDQRWRELTALAGVHEALSQLQISYTGVMDNFVDRYVHRLRKLRTDLTHVREMIERRHKPQ